MPQLMIEAARLDAERLAEEWIGDLLADDLEVLRARLAGAVDDRLLLVAGALYALKALASPGVTGSTEMFTALAGLRAQIEAAP